MLHQWVNVNEKLPSKDGEYLVCKEWGGIRHRDICSFCKNGNDTNEFFLMDKNNVFYHNHHEVGLYTTNNVKYWSELPELPH